MMKVGGSNAFRGGQVTRIMIHAAIIGKTINQARQRHNASGLEFELKRSLNLGLVTISLHLYNVGTFVQALHEQCIISLALGW